MLITSLLLSVLTCNPGFAYHLNAQSALPLGEVKSLHSACLKAKNEGCKNDESSHINTD